MKISLNNRPIFLQQGELMKTPATERGIQKNSGKFDEVCIQKNAAATMSDDKFVSQLKEKLMAEVAKPTPSQQLETIKNQINSNTYSINLDEVAQKIMLTH